MQSCRYQLIAALLLLNGAFLAPAAQPPSYRSIYRHKPIDSTSNPYWNAPINRDRLYDFYAKQALYFSSVPPAKRPLVLPQFPGLDGGRGKGYGHLGNQTDKTWRDSRLNNMKHGSMIAGTLHGAGRTINRATCVKLGQNLNAVFNQQTLRFALAWQGRTVHFSDVRQGLVNGLYMPTQQTATLVNATAPIFDAQYLGLYRKNGRVVFAYRRNKKTFYRAAYAKDGQVIEYFLSAKDAKQTGEPQWPKRIITTGTLGADHQPYTLDTLTLPYENPWNSLLFLGGVDFITPTRLAVSTLQGDVWLCDISGADLKTLTWKRFAAGLYQPLGLKVVDGLIHVMCRDGLIALHDNNNDDEADFYQCVSNKQFTPPGGHSFITGLQRDNTGQFYFNSAAQGVCRVSPDGQTFDVLATGLRFPNGIGVNTDGSVLLASVQEGNWTPASAICDIKQGAHYGFGGPKEGELGYVPPMIYLPRGEDSSAGGQVYIDSMRWGPVQNNWIHFSGALAKHFLILREVINGKSQAAAVPLWGEFLSGSHRGRMSPYDGQLYVAGAQGYGNYGTQDGSLQRVRYTGGPYHYPSQYETRSNGILLTFDQPQPAAIAKADLWFAQQWNYRYSLAYGSPEFSVKYPQQKGHDPLRIRSVHQLNDGKQLFIEIPQLQPVNQLHLYYQGAATTQRLEFFATIHNLDQPFTDFPNYQPIKKRNALPTPQLADMFDPAAMIQACAACHHPTIRVVGPPFSEIKQRYANNPQGIVDWAMNPQNKTPDSPPMPSFHFLGEEKLMIIAKQILANKQSPNE